MEEFDHNNNSNYSGCLEEFKLFAQLEDDLPAELFSPNPELDLLGMGFSLMEPSPDQGEEKPPGAAKKRGRGAARDHTCDVCGRRFSEAYNLRIHKMTHTDEKPHRCQECGKGFRQLNKLRIHSVTHTEDRPHQCDICGKGFRYANYLSVHRRLHTGEKPYPCLADSCDLTFHSVHARRIHMKLRHPEERVQEQTSSLSYTCPVCGRVLTDQCYLSTHLKRHYNQRDHACPHPECGKRFFSASELKHHQIAHSQLRPFGCPLCGARFLRKSNCKQHLKVHGESSKASGCMNLED